MKMKRTQTFTQVPAGTYEATLQNLEAKTIQTNDGPTDIVEWVFAIREEELEGALVSGSTSMAWSEKSKAFAWGKSLNGNRPWDMVDSDGDPDIAGLVGLDCLIEVVEKVSPTGIVRSKVESVMPDPAAMKKSKKLPF